MHTIRKKYPVSFKKKVVNDYIKNHIGFKPLARKYNLSYSTVRNWVMVVKVNGFGALDRSHRRTFEPTFKAEVVRYYQNHNSGYTVVAARFNVAPAIVVTWVKLFEKDGIEGLMKHSRRPQTVKKKKRKVRSTKIGVDKEKQYQDRIKALEDQLHYTQMERDLAKKYQALTNPKKKK